MDIHAGHLNVLFPTPWTVGDYLEYSYITIYLYTFMEH